MPDKAFVFIFDNSSAHGSFAPDALTVTKMTVNPAGKNTPNMHDTIIPSNNPHRVGGTIQNMQFPSHLPCEHQYKIYEGKPKGMQVILEERKLIKPAEKGKGMVNFCTQKKLIGECAKCKKRKARKPHLELLSKEEQEEADDEDSADDTEGDEARAAEEDCCMKRMLANQADFKAERSLLEKVCLILLVPLPLSLHLLCRSSLVQGTNVCSCQNSTASSIQLSTTGDGLSTIFGRGAPGISINQNGF